MSTTDGKTLASGQQDGAIRLWSVATGDELLAWRQPTQINSLSFSSDGQTLAAALHDGTIKLLTGRAQQE